MKLSVVGLIGAFVLGAAGRAIGTPPTQPQPPATSSSSSAATALAPSTNGVQQIEWDTLLPPEQRNQVSDAAPPPVHDYLGEGGMAAMQSGSYDVNLKLNRAKVKIPGFVVPLDILPNDMVREFFLVPYFGACIHVPPPPPNQIVYVKLGMPVKVGSIYDAVWITGVLRAETKASRIGSAAYTLDGIKVEPYQY